MKLRFFLLIILITVVALQFGCPKNNQVATSSVKAFSAADFADADSGEKLRHKKDPSSLWFEAQHTNWLFTDRKATHVNDVVTIQIIEESVAKNKAETKTNRGSSIGAGLSGLFGLEKTLARSNPDMNLETLIGAKFNNKFTGKGETSRSGKLIATISAIVVDVLPNGNLKIQGRRTVKVNNEQEIIILTGIIRPRDVSAENVVLSTAIADAQIEYIGRGVVADKQKPGWLSRGLDKVWPF